MANEDQILDQIESNGHLLVRRDGVRVADEDNSRVEGAGFYWTGHFQSTCRKCEETFCWMCVAKNPTYIGVCGS